MFGCIHVPDFPVQAALLDESQDQALALVDGPESLLKVVACNKGARSAGVRIGITKLQAEAFGVELRKRIPADEESAQAALIDCAYKFSPRIEATVPGTIIFDLTGSERLMGDDNAIAGLILTQVTDRGFEGNVSIAANPDAAHCAAKGFKGVTLIDEGDEAWHLNMLPITVLEPELEVLDILHAWGVRNLKSLAALPDIQLTERLGQYGLHLQRLARGAVTRELIPHELPTPFRESEELEETVELLEPLCAVIKGLLSRLLERLIERSLATDRIDIDLALEPHADREASAAPLRSSLMTYPRTVKVPVPVQDADVLLKLIHLDLAAHPPFAPVKKVIIEATPAHIRYTQAGLFQRLAPEPARLEIAMARIEAEFGEKDSQGRGRVGFVTLLDSNRPDAFQVTRSPAKSAPQGEAVAPANLLHRLRPAIPARVEVSAERVPIWIGFLQKRARVIEASGPWRRDGEWWDSKDKWLREEWDIQLDVDGRSVAYRFYRDLSTKQWFVEGIYD
jgi:protein ImuB